MSSLVAPGPLRARSVWLDQAVDLLTVAGADGWLWEREGVGFAGLGVAVRISVGGGISFAEAAVDAALGAIETDDGVGVPGSGPVAVGALPFDREAPVGRKARLCRWTCSPALISELASPMIAPAAAATRGAGGIPIAFWGFSRVCNQEKFPLGFDGRGIRPRQFAPRPGDASGRRRR